MFDNKSVFITGASGFIGRVLLEKLLRCYPGIKNIYLLMRSKKNVSPAERLHKTVLDAPIFDHVKQARRAGNGKQALIDKIIVVGGDIGEPRLGISDDDMQMLLNDPTLSIVFHSAATIKFDDPLKVSVQLNLIATKSIVEFARKLKNLVSICHVSTAFVNSHLANTDVIEETLYPMDQTPQQVIALAENLDEDMMQQLKPALVADRPNTYTYTKALAEHLIAMEASDLPIAIVRPSIVVASWREPLPGWIDNINGPTGMLLAIGKGLCRTAHVVREYKSEIIPVDVAVNFMIAAAYYAAKTNNKLGSAQQDSVKIGSSKQVDPDETISCNGSITDASAIFESSNGVPIFHCTSGDLRPILWGELEDSVYPVIKHYPSVETYRYPFGSFKRYKYHDLVTRLFVHLLPALLLDSISGLVGRKRKLMWIYSKLHAAQSVLSFFMTNQFNFQTKNLHLLRDAMDEADRKQLFTDIENILWILFWNDYILGCR